MADASELYLSSAEDSEPEYVDPQIPAFCYIRMRALPLMRNKYQKRDEEMELNNVCYDDISGIQHGGVLERGR
jgi:hypothetical protein